MKNKPRVSSNIKGISSEHLKRPVRVYDVAKKAIIGKFDSLVEASEFTGVSTGTIYKCIRTKCRSYKNKLDKAICFR